MDTLQTNSVDLRKNLNGLKDLDSIDESRRLEFLNFLESADQYYEFLAAGKNQDLKEIVLELKNWREKVYNARAKEMVDFLLIRQTKVILRVANARFLKVYNDVDRLVDLKIIQKDTVQVLLNEASVLLAAANDMTKHLADGEEDVRELISASLAKIKLAYKKFLEISALVQEELR